MAELEGPDRLITIARAAEIAGRTPRTLRKAVKAGRLEARNLGPDWVTTRRHLHTYLMDRRRSASKPLPEGYQAPVGEDASSC
jgi:hypothetical protein